MNDENLKYWMALKSVNGIGNASFQPLLDRFGTLAAVFSAAVSDLSAVPGINPKTAAAIASFQDWDGIVRQLAVLDKMNVDIITCLDESYPRNLLNIYDRPAFLYVSGHLEKDDIPLAIVGSRQASSYGKFTTERISRELALRGITIVSGMARGIDSCAHRGALAMQGRTIAVLGSGLDVIYPPENKKLFNAISQNGAVISEFPPGTQPLPYHFPQRNRIISGMSYGVVVVEAGEKSGSLITARLAMEQGRDVFAIPGTIDSPSSRGTNSLIKQGAKLIDSVDDILEDILPQIECSSPCSRPEMQKWVTGSFSQTAAEKNSEKPRTLHQMILNILSQEKMHADDIITAIGLPSADVVSALLILELKGQVLQHPGKFFSLKE